MKEPAARLVKVISTMSPVYKKIPAITPRGEAIEKMKINQRTVVKSSGKVFTSEIPKELEAAPLWMTIAITIFKVPENSPESPRARPSKIACTERAIISTKGVTLQEQHPFFLGTLSSRSFTFYSPGTESNF
jgi:hypothetical protein